MFVHKTETRKVRTSYRVELNAEDIIAFLIGIGHVVPANSLVIVEDSEGNDISDENPIVITWTIEETKDQT